jgi:hypothetical protein
MSVFRAALSVSGDIVMTLFHVRPLIILASQRRAPFPRRISCRATDSTGGNGVACGASTRSCCLEVLRHVSTYKGLNSHGSSSTKHLRQETTTLIESLLPVRDMSTMVDGILTLRHVVGCMRRLDTARHVRNMSSTTIQAPTTKQVAPTPSYRRIWTHSA